MKDRKRERKKRDVKGCKGKSEEDSSIPIKMM